MPSSSTKSRKGSSSRRHDAPVDEWKQFTSPEGHPYFYNAATKESRWELPVADEATRRKHRRPKGSSRTVILNEENFLNEEEKSLKHDEKSVKLDKIHKNKKRPESRKSATEPPRVHISAKPKNAMFQQLQASLEGRIGGPMMGMRGPPPILNIRREEEINGATGQENIKAPTSLEEQYETETAGMSAAERLRFLRKKRQENMIIKRESIAGDDFMAEVAKNMKKKGVTVMPKERKSQAINDERLSWKEQEQAEEERKRQQMQDKEQQEATKEREQQAAKETDQRRKQEREQQQEEENRKTVDKDEKERQDVRETDHGITTDASDPEARDRVSTVDRSEAPIEEDSDASSPERVKSRRRSRSHGSSAVFVDQEPMKQVENVEEDHPPAETEHSAESVAVVDFALEETRRAREERRALRKRDKELAARKSGLESLRRKSVDGSNEMNEELRTNSSRSVEAEEETRAREKQQRRERRRMAKVEAALAAQSLEGDQDDVRRVEAQQKHPDSNTSAATGSAQTGGFSMYGQPQAGQPPLSGGMYPPYPYVMMPSPYGYYYPYMPSPPMSMPMYPPGMVPSGYHMIPPTPPPSMDGMTTTSALIPYSADPTLANGYDISFGGLYGQQVAPELSRCECCKGIGVGLVEKNGVCAHCNRLRLAFIVDSAQMRQRCSVCGGWGVQLLEANGMCEHCTRQTAQKSLAKLVPEAAARRRSVAAPASGAVSGAAPSRRNSMGILSKSEERDDVDWDNSSSDDSEWDE